MQNLQEQQVLASQLESQYAEALAAQQAALDAQQNAAPTSAGRIRAAPVAVEAFVPPPNASAAAIAVSAAYSAIGAPYVFGAAGPSSFDCSGLTSWAWAQAGVYLPHSAAAQYSSLPSVPLSEVQPGDIIYYGNFGPHVAIYVGGGDDHSRPPPRPRRRGAAELDVRLRHAVRRRPARLEPRRPR